jgi:hypothetical protein
MILGAALGLFAIYWLATSASSSSSAPKTALAVESVDHAEKTLTRLRAQAATVPGREAVLKKVSNELVEREKGLIKGDTAAQAQAQLLQILREVARNQTPPLVIRNVELGNARAYGDAYGEVTVAINLDCRIDQLVNFLAYLSSQPELISTDDIRFGASNAKTKNSPIRVTISALVPRKLVPVKKAVAQF